MVTTAESPSSAPNERPYKVIGYAMARSPMADELGRWHTGTWYVYDAADMYGRDGANHIAYASWDAANEVCDGHKMAIVSRCKPGSDHD